MVRSTHDLRVGERIGDYRIRRVLGRGGAGTVYEADGPGGPVALKLMHEQDPSGVGRKRFDREAALVQKFRHPHVVALLGFGREGGLPYIVFELLRGRSLKSVIRREGAIDISTAGRMALQMLDALMAAHAMGIVHRDIKPANVYLCEDHGPDYLKVLDFGLAKALEGEGAEVATITDTGYRLGTPRYMSPEMARGQEVTNAGDIYGLGLVFAEMLTGMPVVKATSQIDVMMMHASDEPLALDDGVTTSPFFKCIQKALSKAVRDRYAAAADMRDDVKKALQLHEQAVQIAQRFPDASASGQTLLMDAGQSGPQSDPLLATDEMDPTPQMVPELMETAPLPKAPAHLANTMAFPEGFDTSMVPALDPARSAPTVQLRDLPPSPRAALQELPPATVRRAEQRQREGQWITLAIVLVLIVTAVGVGIALLR